MDLIIIIGILRGLNSYNYNTQETKLGDQNSTIGTN